MKVWWKFPIKNSDLSENLIARGSIHEPFLTWETPSEDPSEVHFFEKCWILGKLVSQKIWNVARNGPRIIHFGRNLVEMKPNRLIKPFRSVLDRCFGPKNRKIANKSRANGTGGPDGRNETPQNPSKAHQTLPWDSRTHPGSTPQMLHNLTDPLLILHSTLLRRYKWGGPISPLKGT